MAHQITGEQVGVVLPQVAFEPVHLAGHAGEEHRRTGVQQRLHLGEGIAQVALDVLGAPHGGQLLHCAGAHVAGGHALVQRRAEHRVGVGRLSFWTSLLRFVAPLLKGTSATTLRSIFFAALRASSAACLPNSVFS